MFVLVEYKIFFIILLVFCKYFLLRVRLNLIELGEFGLIFFVDVDDIFDWLIVNNDFEVLLFFLNLIVKVINYRKIEFLVLVIDILDLFFLGLL